MRRARRVWVYGAELYQGVFLPLALARLRIHVAVGWSARHSEDNLAPEQKVAKLLQGKRVFAHADRAGVRIYAAINRPGRHSGYAGDQAQSNSCP